MMIKQLFSTIAMAILYVFFLIHYILFLLFFPVLWVKYRLLPYKKRLIEIELMVRVIDISLDIHGSFEGLLLGNKAIYIAEKKEKLPSVYYISKNNFAEFAEHITIVSSYTILAALELSYWKYGFGKSRLVSYKLVDKKPKIRK